MRYLKKIKLRILKIFTLRYQKKFVNERDPLDMENAYIYITNYYKSYKFTGISSDTPSSKRDA
jgi:hypothetical protein